MVRQSPQRVSLLRDGKPVFARYIGSTDTMLFDDSLQPKHTYRYVAYRYCAQTLISDTTVALTVLTMDTTSHEFTWEIDTLGDGNSSALYDAVIINDTLAYAVGEMYRRDSTGQFETEPYNAAVWDGRGWKLFRIPTAMYGGSVGTYRLNTICAFGVSDVWTFSIAGSYSHWDGQSWSTQYVAERSGAGLKMWGASSTDLYLVGTNGSLSHFDGRRWRKTESGTNVDLFDVYGSPDGSLVWACGYYEAQQGTFLLRNRGSGWETAYDGTQSEFLIRQDSLSGAFTGVYTENQGRVFVGSSAGLYRALSTTHGEGKRLSFTSNYFPGFPRGLRGNGINDLVIAGDYTFIAHFNGVSWRYYDELRTSNEHINSISMRNDRIVAVGVITDPINSRGVAIQGRR